MKSSVTISAVVLLLAITGCTSAAPAPTVTPTVNASAWPTITMAGTGQVDKTTAIPAGAKSLRVEFVCSSGLFDVSMNSDTSRSGSCGGTRSWLLPLPPYDNVGLTVSVPTDTRYALSATFSTDKFVPDRVIAAECKTLSGIYTAFRGTEDGYAHSDVTAAQWTATVTKTVAELKKLAASASGIIGAELPAVVTWYTRDGLGPGDVLTSAGPGSYSVATELISQVCSDNGSVITIQAHHGG
ncbi:hypothetical protein [Rathayibacter soli]|uniref:hypothetical protein n=1 Tax=Rathayibacter soli TaxID=3144168 RepID=UPI0027E444B6|nr:hypothetical protein [Glaciibacter superstes]